jgi:molecular chaperone DnaK
MKETAGAYLGEPVTQAVILVPAISTTASGRRRRMPAASPNPSAAHHQRTDRAALAYGMEKKGRRSRFNLGGGTFDISVLRIGQRAFRRSNRPMATHFSAAKISTKDHRLPRRRVQKEQGKPTQR